MYTSRVSGMRRVPMSSFCGCTGASSHSSRSSGQFSITSLSGLSTQKARGALWLRSSRTEASRMLMSITESARLTPRFSQKWRIAAGV